jgi:hypothetical protein
MFRRRRLLWVAVLLLPAGLGFGLVKQVQNVRDAAARSADT